jgi:hypothetical protein
VPGSMNIDYLGLFMVLGVGKNIPHVFLLGLSFFSAGKVFFLVLYRCEVVGRRDFGPGPVLSVFLFLFCARRDEP